LNIIVTLKRWSEVTQGQVRGRSRSFKMAPFDRPNATFYWSAIANIALSYDTIRYDSVYLTCSKKLRGSQLVPFTSYLTFNNIVTYSNCGRICSRLWYIQCQRMAWPWKPS